MQQLFEGGTYRDQQGCSFTNESFVCTHNAGAHTCIIVDPLPYGGILRVTFIGMSCGNISRCGEILRNRALKLRDTSSYIATSRVI